MKSAGCALAVLVAVAGCASGPRAIPADRASTPSSGPATAGESSSGPVTSEGPASVVSPRPAGTAALQPSPAHPAGCALPPEGADDLRASDAATEWRTVWVDRNRGAMNLLAVAADGTVWATFSVEAEREGALVTGDDGVRRWDGTGWQAFEVPLLRRRGAQSNVALAAASARQAWVFGTVNGRTRADTVGFVSAYEGGRWRSQALAKPAADAIGWAYTAARSGAGDRVWAVNGRVALHWNGGSWTCHWGPLGSSLESPARRITAFGQAEPDGRGGLWVLGRGDLLWHLSGGHWTRHRVPAPAGYEAHVTSLARRPGTSQVYAVGSVISRKGNGFDVSRAALWRFPAS
ncbi:hypothetical protein [Thermoactinospora rubra]|uniref:hypothetical protein n=1 Tax=Thermoactinospora rubra TaxID=1088767 RepID=UPI0011817018|nr:hypothetical protein [Thermoactinospora rubra]